MIDFRKSARMARVTIQWIRAGQLTFIAAGVAYYAFVSLVPITLIGLVVVTSIGGEELAREASDATSGVLTPSARLLLTDTITEESGRSGATIVGVVGLIWSGSRVLLGLDRAFSRIYGTVAVKPLLEELRDGVIVTVVIVVGLIALAGVETVLGEAVGGVIQVLSPVFLFFTLLIVFLPLFIVFPDANVDAAEALPGAAFAALGWTILARAFSVYAGFAGTYALYGALGAVFLVLTWLYAGSLILVFGAVLNAVLADRAVGRRIARDADRRTERDADRRDARDADRQVQSASPRQLSTEPMTDDATGTEEGPGNRRTSARTRDRSHDPEALREEIERLRDELESFERNVENRTVQKESLERELKGYVRRRARRGHARGWGPYLVLLYGTAMTIGAFYLLAGGWAVLAMFVVWTSTLGLYVLMVLFSAGFSLLNVPGRVRDAIESWRS